MRMFELVLQAGVIVKLVLLCLFGMSVLSWAVIVYKTMHLRRAARESASLVAAFESGTPLAKLADLAHTLPASPLAGVVLHAVSLKAELPAERLRASLARVTAREAQRLQAQLILLATIGSSAPFIGLFGTVWGIVHAFQKIGETGSASLAVVAPGIAEALVTTAAGLAAAIPAVAAYNHQMTQASQLTDALAPIAAEIPALVKTRER